MESIFTAPPTFVQFILDLKKSRHSCTIQINGDEIASQIGGTPTKMYGYTGYLLEYDDGGHAFVFGMKDKVCMVYVSDYDGFGDVKVIG